MGKNISSYEIARKRSNLINQQRKIGKSIHEMIYEIEGKISNLKEEKDDLTDKKIPCYANEIKNVNKKIEEKEEEKKKCAHVWLAYVHCLEDFKLAKKFFHIICGILGGLSMIISLAITKNISCIPTVIAGAASMDICACLAMGIYNKIIIKKLKLEHFNNKHIKEEEMQEIMKAKEKEINPELDKLNEARRNLVNDKEEANTRIAKISEKMEELAIDRKILIQEAIRNANKEEYIEDYLNDEIKEYCNLISKKSSNNEEKPKVQSKRLKVVGKKLK